MQQVKSSLILNISDRGVIVVAIKDKYWYHTKCFISFRTQKKKKNFHKKPNKIGLGAIDQRSETPPSPLGTMPLKSFFFFWKSSLSLMIWVIVYLFQKPR